MNLFSEIHEGARISWEAIRSNILRSVLTTTGIVIGIVTVTLMATAMEALNGAFGDAISFIGTDVLYVDQREWFIDGHTKWDAIAKRGKITRAQARAVEQAMNMAKGVSPTVMHQIDSVRHENRSSGMVTIIGTNEQFLVTGGVTLTAGRFMTKTEANANRDLCVIGFEVAEKLFVNQSPLGQKIRVGNESLEVIGVLEKRGSVLGQMSLDNQVIIPIGKMFRGFRWDPSCTIQVKVGDPAQRRGGARGTARPAPQNPQSAAGTGRRLRHQPAGAAPRAVWESVARHRHLGVLHHRAVALRRRHRDHEHHVCLRRRAHPRDRHPQSHRRETPHHPPAIPHRSREHLPPRRRHRPRPRRRLCPNRAPVPPRHAHFALSPSVILLALTVAIVTGLISGFLPAWRAARMSPVDALRNE